MAIRAKPEDVTAKLHEVEVRLSWGKMTGQNGPRASRRECNKLLKQRTSPLNSGPSWAPHSGDKKVESMGSSLIVNGILGLLPVLVFLAMLTQSDTFKLVRRALVARLIASGAVAAAISYFLGSAAVREFGIDYGVFVRLWGPILEELLKAIFVIQLIRANRIGFVLDAVIVGFAIGAGFALLENYVYLRTFADGQTALWIVRGFGTAIMHGGATSIFAIISQRLVPQERKGSLALFVPGLAAAILLHIAFNQFLDYPATSTVVMMVGLAVGLNFIQHKDRQSIDKWLEVDFDEYRRLLMDIRAGAFGAGAIGNALGSLRVRFSPPEIAEIVRYVELHTELVLFAEEVLKAEARGKPIEMPAEVKSKLAHFHYLEERIGAAVRLALGQHLKFSRYEFFQLYKLRRDAGQIAPKEHVFNSDLLLNDTDREEARRAFPDIFFALENPHLRESFGRFDDRANRSKARSRRLGGIAVVLVAGGLFLASAEILYRDLPLPALRAAAALGLASGITGVFIGVFGLIYRGRKTRWLADRLATERLRQFHFQHYVENAPAILAGAKNANSAAAYLAERDMALEKFSKAYLEHIDEELHEIVHEEDCGDGVLIDANGEKIAVSDPHLDSFFDAYERLRFTLQLNYCAHVLRESRSLFKPSAARLADRLAAITIAGVFGLLVFQGASLLGVLTDVDWLRSPVGLVLAVWAAILALAARTFEEGLQPKREIERMRNYRILLRRAHARFRDTNDPAQKIAAMRELEKAAYQEMALFLKSNYEAQFVM